MRTLIRPLMKTKSKMFSERIKFYADTERERNKLFTWELPNGILSIQDALKRFFDKRWNIRAAWYEKIDVSTGEIKENTKIDVKRELDAYINNGLSHKQ